MLAAQPQDLVRYPDVAHLRGARASFLCVTETESMATVCPSSHSPASGGHLHASDHSGARQLRANTHQRHDCESQAAGCWMCRRCATASALICIDTFTFNILAAQWSVYLPPTLRQHGGAKFAGSPTPFSPSWQPRFLAALLSWSRHDALSRPARR